MWLLGIFIAVPLIEIGLFIQVGGLIGLWPTLFIVLVTAILGTSLVKREGTQELMNLRRSMNELRDPSASLAHGAMILLAGALLLTPGFFTDAVGLVLLVRPVRNAALLWLKSRVRMQGFAYGEAASARPRSEDPTIIEGTAEEVGAPKRPTHRPSGWTQH